MDTSFIFDNLLSPPILFFALGLVAVMVRSDLDLPAPLPTVLSLYLLFAIGFKGGVALRAVSADQAGYVAIVMLAAIFMAAVVPVVAYAILRRRLNVADAAATAATYGSISAVTFITAIAFLNKQQLEWGGYMVAAMALMESPAIVIAVMLVRKFGAADSPAARSSWGKLLHEAFLNGPVFLLLGSLVVGAMSNVERVEAIQTFVGDLFNVVLVIFLLDMGLIAGRRIGDLKQAGAFLVTFALLMPLAGGAAGLLLAWLIGMPPGDALLFVVLCASASYIAVPAACRLAIPQANASIYVPMALAVTFPFNITVGIPIYWTAVYAVLG